MMKGMKPPRPSDDSPPRGNRSLVLHGVDDLRLEDRPVPTPGAQQVLLCMRSVGICGSDVHYWKDGCIGPFRVTRPMVMGHEASGVVVEVGAGVSHLQPGDRVAIEPGVPCRSCHACGSGRYNLCPHITFCATPPYDGNLCQYYVHHADFCFKLPDHLSFDEGALIEPLSVAIHASRRAGIQMGDHVAIIGAGPIGLVNLLTARCAGATHVTVVDVNDDRLKLAKSMGADHTLNPSHAQHVPAGPSHAQPSGPGLPGTTPEPALSGVVGTAINSSQAQHTLVNPSQAQPVPTSSVGMWPEPGGSESTVHWAALADVTLECSGTEAGMAAAIAATRPGGVLMQIGCAAGMVRLPLMDASTKEVDIKGVFRYCHTYPTAIALLSSGRIDVKPLVTHHFGLEEAVRAFETARTGAGGAVKVIIRVD
eukprot:jgi/Mesvir1/9696/Mv12174-RA.1